MDIAALLAWVVTALGGFYLLGVWLSHGGMRQQESGASHLPAPLILGHMGVAAVGLLVWIAYVLADNAVLAWSALGVLAPVVALGFGMLVTWIPVRRARAQSQVRAGAGVGAAAPAAPSAEEPAERHFPLAVVLLHGLLAVTTLVLVLLAAIDASS